MPERSNQNRDAAERAQALRKEIERLKSGSGGGSSNTDRADNADQKGSLSPRDFINKRMDDLDKKR
jgi:hypothetical protein